MEEFAWHDQTFLEEKHDAENFFVEKDILLKSTLGRLIYDLEVFTSDKSANDSWRKVTKCKKLCRIFIAEKESKLVCF